MTDGDVVEEHSSRHPIHKLGKGVMGLADKAILTVIANKVHQYDSAKHANKKWTCDQLILVAVLHVTQVVMLN